MASWEHDLTKQTWPEAGISTPKLCKKLFLITFLASNQIAYFHKSFNYPIYYFQHLEMKFCFQLATIISNCSSCVQAGYMD